MDRSKRKQMSGRGAAGKTAVVGVQDRRTKRVRAETVHSTAPATPQGFIAGHAVPSAKVQTDDAGAYLDMPFAGQGSHIVHETGHERTRSS